MKYISMAFRMALTAYCFAQFAVQVLWLGRWVMPRIMKSHGYSIQKRSRALFYAHKHVLLYLNTLSQLRLVSFEFRGKALNEPSIIVANHPSLLDFIVLLRDYPNAICVYKSQTRHNMVLANFVNVAGYVEGMDGTREASKRIISECCHRLEEGHHIVLFPEGTRSKSNVAVGRFRSTGFHAAVRSGAPIQPVLIYCEPLFLGKNQSWLEFSKRQNKMIIEYQTPIRIEDLEEDYSAKGVADYVRKSIKRRLIELRDKKD